MDEINRSNLTRIAVNPEVPDETRLAIRNLSPEELMTLSVTAKRPAACSTFLKEAKGNSQTYVRFGVLGLLVGIASWVINSISSISDAATSVLIGISFGLGVGTNLILAVSDLRRTLRRLRPISLLQSHRDDFILPAPLTSAAVKLVGNMQHATDSIRGELGSALSDTTARSISKKEWEIASLLAAYSGVVTKGYCHNPTMSGEIKEVDEALQYIAHQVAQLELFVEYLERRIDSHGKGKGPEKDSIADAFDNFNTSWAQAEDIHRFHAKLLKSADLC
ncbi:hypothetical protein [Streptomyces sp. VNUA24]|uniref:hypothetical protein n=1 Tax=Streptomyces sp. VNUA24 TaxID=3031131 RepID=UPI0023B787FF|nr:hypothetical protein [Streptomyces sp. VNUA24]WEH18444.1 hypothetical protein PYR72_34150 [Streptomyces sp. VNUA24]